MEESSGSAPKSFLIRDLLHDLMTKNSENDVDSADESGNKFNFIPHLFQQP